MNWKVLVFWILVWCGLFWYFFSLNFYFYQQQEEMQLFIPEWSTISEILRVPGGFCNFFGEFLIQYYHNVWFALIINASLVCAIGVFSYLLLQQISVRTYNIFLSLIPVLVLMKIHLNLNFILDGTIGLLLMAVFLYVSLQIKLSQTKLIYNIISSFVIYYLIGQLIILYSILLILLYALCRREKWLYSFIVLVLSLIYSFIGICLSLYIPLTDGLHSEQYQMLQLQPDSFMYFVWLRFSAVMFILFGVTYLLKLIPQNKRWQRWTFACCVIIGIFSFSILCMPNKLDIYDRMIGQLSYLEQNQRWDDIIRMHEGRKIKDYTNLNYLNMALAQKGELGSRLFHFDQKGPEGLVAQWDRTYFMSALLSDIHFMIGDISTSESYAMDALTMAKRKGSPRIIKRLTEISLTRRDFKLAEKYINLLSQMPFYHVWAEKHREYIYHPEKMNKDRMLAHKQCLNIKDDNLLCLIGIDSLWRMHLTEPYTNHIAFEYLGCSYLLAKKMDLFKTLLLRIENSPEWEPLPIHFQEAALVIAVKDLSIFNSVKVKPEIVERFKQFQQDVRQIQADNGSPSQLQQQYGDTFWFYYYFKKI